MKNILLPKHLAILRKFVAANPLIVFDYDGTLSPIVNDPAKARMRASTRRLLVRLAGRFRSAILSGRARTDVQKRLEKIPLFAIVGNHGAEWGDRSDKIMRARIESWRNELQTSLAGRECVIEDKGLSLSVHLRREGNNRAHIMAGIAQLKGVRIVPGKRVFNIMPAEASDKGTALKRLLEQSKRTCSIFVGDDETDEDAFRAKAELTLLTIRIGQRVQSAADFYLPKQQDIDHLLDLLLKVV